jgi:hypothetical protein
MADFSSDEDEDLRRAIALSLQEAEAEADADAEANGSATMPIVLHDSSETEDDIATDIKAGLSMREKLCSRF